MRSRHIRGTIVAEMWRRQTKGNDRKKLHNPPFWYEMAEDAVTGIASGSRIEERS
jgi:hypothetical protein